MTYLLIDAMNMAFRARHSAFSATPIEEKCGFALHVLLQSIAKCWREQKADHVVICLDGHSWRKEVYSNYKKRREVTRQARTVAEQEEDQLFFKVYNDLIEFFKTKTNLTVLFNEKLEADDLIAGWIQHHPSDQHVIISSDSDYIQLLSDTVSQYNGITDELITTNGIYDRKRQLVIDKKTKQPKQVPNPEWALFEKIVRGDATDDVFSACPGIRVKSSKNKIGLKEIFEDRHKQGFAWNSLMQQTWTDHNGVEHSVLEDVNRNRMLIDLSAQPEPIRQVIHETISAVEPQTKPMVGMYLLKFCGQHGLVKISESADLFASILSASYKGK